MGFGSRIAGTRRKKAGLAIGLVALLAGSGTGVYLHLRLGSETSPPAHAKEPVRVGTRTVSHHTASILTVVSTSPTDGSMAAPVNTTLTLNFNLPVDPAAVQSHINLMPDNQGTFSQGTTPDQVLFTPSQSFQFGTTVSAVLLVGLPSLNGSTLLSDYRFAFDTAPAADSVSFATQGGQEAMLVSGASGSSVSLTLSVGQGVPSDATVQTFQASSDDLLQGLVYSSQDEYLANPVTTAALTPVGSAAPAQDGATLSFTEPDGIYVVVAADAAGQYGSVWLDFSQYGVLMRQDDQQIVVAGEDLTTGDTSPTFTIDFYDLQGAVQLLQSGSFSGTASFPFPYPETPDLAIASTGGEDVVIPISAPETDADIKVMGSLAEAAQVYLTTDRVAYQAGDMVEFAGVARLSNDEAYTIPQGATVTVGDTTNPANTDVQVAVASDGTFSGSWPIPDDDFSADGSAQAITLQADVMSGQTSLGYATAQIETLGSQAPAGSIYVTLNKSDYLADDTIVASISGTDATGLPLSDAPVSLTIYSSEYQTEPAEMDSFPSLSTLGAQVGSSIPLTLDSTGHAQYSFSANVAQNDFDQDVTVEATYGSGPTAAGGAQSAVVYQASDDVFLLPSRTAYRPGDEVTVPFVVENHEGARVPDLALTYQLYLTTYEESSTVTTVVASGTVTTDANGLGTVQYAYAGPSGEVSLSVTGNDASGNSFTGSTSFLVTDDPDSLVSNGALDSLLNLSVTTDKIAYTIGDVAHLTITAPASETVLLSLERGRIHQYQLVQLTQGANPLSLTITSDLAPGFDVVFTYFSGGDYVSEGMPISVSNQDQIVQLSVTPDQQTYAPGQTATLTITATDASGAPVAASLIVDGYDADMSAWALVDRPSIAQTFLTPSLRATNGSSSLLGIGSWGGRCGGGDNTEPTGVSNPGPLSVWAPDLTTDSSGQATITVPISQETVRVWVIASTPSNDWGQADIDLKVQ
jgi:uncharacterized protein YfaS (alpha-2-macroglobulin family)